MNLATMSNNVQPEVIPLWPDGPPGSEGWTQQEQEFAAPAPASFRLVGKSTRGIGCVRLRCDHSLVQ